MCKSKSRTEKFEDLDRLDWNIKYAIGQINGTNYMFNRSTHRIEIKRMAIERLKQRFNKVADSLKF